jgi:hypothetical protein
MDKPNTWSNGLRNASPNGTSNNSLTTASASSPLCPPRYVDPHHTSPFAPNVTNTYNAPTSSHVARARTLPSTPNATPPYVRSPSATIYVLKDNSTTSLASTTSSGPLASNSMKPFVQPPHSLPLAMSSSPPSLPSYLNMAALPPSSLSTTIP